MTTYSKIVTFGSPNRESVTTDYPTITNTESGRRKQHEATREMVGSGSCTEARVIVGPDRKAVSSANIANFLAYGCRED